MKIQILECGKNDLFIFVDGKLKGRTSVGPELLSKLSELTGHEIVMEQYPGDALYKLLSPQ